MFVAWRRIKRQEAVYAYANRALVNTYLAANFLGNTHRIESSIETISH
jgi:hypothetical protein